MELTKADKSNPDAIANWDPYEMPPQGVRIENLRRRGIDVLRFCLEVPSRGNQLLYGVPFFLGLSIIAFSIYLLWHKSHRAWLYL